MLKRLLVLASLLLAQPAFAQQLTLETKIPLGDVSGRIDHFSYDPTDRLLFVAELGNDSVGIVDLKDGKVRHLTGLREPQGVAWHAATRTLYVANAGDGSVRLSRGLGSRRPARSRWATMRTTSASTAGATGSSSAMAAAGWR